MNVEDIFKESLEGRKWLIKGTGEGPVEGVVELAQFDGCLTLHIQGRDALRMNPLQLSDLKFEPLAPSPRMVLGVYEASEEILSKPKSSKKK